MSKLTRSTAGWLAGSPFLRRGRRLMEANEKNWSLPMSKSDKLLAGAYLIAAHHADGRFPPRFTDREAAHEAERQYLDSLPGVARQAAEEGMTRKPFWNARSFSMYARDFGQLLATLESVGLQPGCRLLELGSGGGWMAGFLATTGYRVLATTIGGPEVDILVRREQSLEALGLGGALGHAVAPMETVDQLPDCPGAFDGVFVYEALHHAFAWPEAVQAAFRCLRPGGWFVIAKEPNVLHTAISYRVAWLSRTHEIGFRRAGLVRGLKEAGFGTVRVLHPRWNNLVSPFWIVAQRPAGPAPSAPQ